MFPSGDPLLFFWIGLGSNSKLFFNFASETDSEYMKLTHIDLTTGSVTPTMLRFAVPMILGNLFQQVYNLADTLIVGHFLGVGALAAVGASYTLMVFLNSIQLGLCMGSGAAFSIYYGAQDFTRLHRSRFVAFVLIGLLTLVLNIAVFLWLDPLMGLMHVPADIYTLMREYLWAVCWGIGFTFLYNYYASLLRAVGDSLTPLLFLAISVVLNIGLDLLFILPLDWGVAGAAWATVIAQAVSAFSLMIYTYGRVPELRIRRSDMHFSRDIAGEIASFSLLTCVQQSVMNLGILMVQGLVNSFGTVVMAAFTVAVKIDTLAYMPAQDFGNAFSTFIAQNFGAKRFDRIRHGIRSGAWTTFLFCAVVSVAVFMFAEQLMMCFVDAGETELIRTGAGYLRIEGAFYVGIGCLFLLYGYYRAIKRPGMSVVLTVISLGTRVVLAYLLAAVPSIGVVGIWWAIPIGWFLADAVGILCLNRLKPVGS